MRTRIEEDTAGLRIVPLADVPGALPKVAAWLSHEWWKRDPANSLQTVIIRLQQCQNRDRLDVTLVCMEGRTPIGTASIVRSDMDTRRELTPWLAALYVASGARGRGVGTALAQAAVDCAARLGFRRLHLYTIHATAFYLRNGWEIVGPQKLADGRDATILGKSTMGMTWQ